MSVHYKFKSTLDFDTITFDGLYISVGDLKKEILQQKRLGKLTDFDLQVTNAQTKEEYNDESSLIPKNTSLIIARIPLTQPKKSWDTQAKETAPNRVTTRVDGGSLDLSKMDGTEEDKINAMMMQSTADYDPKSYQRLKGQSQVGEVPASYRCNRCKKTGHWIKNCPFNGSKEHAEVKRNTGIPRSFLEKDRDKELQEEVATLPAEQKKQEIPDDLVCAICADLFTDAVMIPCCGSSFCDDCVRTALLESEENECPDCKEKNCSPESLIPNRFLRNSVNVFKNETGYIAPQVKKAPNKRMSTPPVEQKEAIVEETEAASENKAQEEDIKTTAAAEQDTNGNAHAHDEAQNGAPATTDAELAAENAPTTGEAPTTETKVLESPNFEETESDYEDNITVTVPTSQTEAQRAAFRERPYNENNSRALKPPGIDSSPRNQLQSSSYHGHGRENERRSPLLSHPPYAHWDEREREHNDREHERERGRENKGGYAMGMPGQGPYMTPYMDMNEHGMRPMNPYDMYAQDPNHRMGMYPSMSQGHNQMGGGPPPVQMHGMGSFNNMYNPIPPRPTMG